MLHILYVLWYMIKRDAVTKPWKKGRETMEASSIHDCRTKTYVFPGNPRFPRNIMRSIPESIISRLFSTRYCANGKWQIRKRIRFYENNASLIDLHSGFDILGQLGAPPKENFRRSDHFRHGPIRSLYVLWLYRFLIRFSRKCRVSAIGIQIELPIFRDVKVPPIRACEVAQRCHQFHVIKFSIRSKTCTTRWSTDEVKQWMHRFMVEHLFLQCFSNAATDKTGARLETVRSDTCILVMI